MKSKCPNCQRILLVPDGYRGKQIKCSGCQQFLVAKPIEEIAESPATEESVSTVSSRNLWITRIIIATGLAWLVGLACGVLLTRHSRLYNDFYAPIGLYDGRVDLNFLPKLPVLDERKTDSSDAFREPVLTVHGQGATMLRTKPCAKACKRCFPQSFVFDWQRTRQGGKTQGKQ